MKNKKRKEMSCVRSIPDPISFYLCVGSGMALRACARTKELIMEGDNGHRNEVHSL
jgi:hypothetical protein